MKKKSKKSDRDVSSIMRKVRSRDTTPERAFRKELRARGLRYQLYSSRLAGKPDITLPSKRLAIFIDGDFWHGGQWRRRRLRSLEEQFRDTKLKTYWIRKIRNNMQRDCVSTASILRKGWRVVRFWESDVRKDLGACIEMTIEAAQDELKPTPFSILPEKSFAEFFAGIGLMRLALEKQGWTPAYANDIDPKKREMYASHFQDAGEYYHLADIHDISPDSVFAMTLATASFPCNDLSLAGARKGLAGKQSSAFWGFIRILDGMGDRKPPLVLLENVAGFLTSAKGADFRDALLALNRLGYDVDAFILDAVNFVPQSRQRLFVVGVLSDGGGESAAAPPRFPPSDVRPKALADFMAHHPEVRWRIRPLPDPPRRKGKLVDVLERLPDRAPEWWNERRAEYLLNQMSPRHRAQAQEMIDGVRWSYATVFRRIRKGKSMAELRTDGIAGCLRTPRGGSARQILFKGGKGKYFVRFLSPRECARLMGADDYRIEAPLNQALFGFGDAVCVPVIEWIATYYLNPVVNELLRNRPLAAPK
jgi:DNA (cytosine-5)-methyltransferase 1